MMAPSSKVFNKSSRFYRAFDLFVGSRFYVLAVFIITYYFHRYFLVRNIVISHKFAVALLTVIGVAFIANMFMWVAHYKERIQSGVAALLEASDDPQKDEHANAKEDEALAQARTANAKIIAILLLILGILSQYQYVGDDIKLPDVHRIPALSVVMLVLIALFDAALDLEAEWTISMIARTRTARSEGKSYPTLSSLLWLTNQFRPNQRAFLAAISNKRMPAIGFSAFSASAQNLISFATVAVGGICGAMAYLVLQKW